MEEDFNTLEQQQKHLVDDFISNNNLRAFKKIFHTKTLPKPRKNFFLSGSYLKPSEVINRFRSQHRIMYHSSNTSDTDDHYHINRYNFIDDPESKDKKMKGNYKWASQKFELIKMNWAKRKGIPFNEYQVPKIVSPISKESKVINGSILAHSMKNIQLPKI